MENQLVAVIVPHYRNVRETKRCVESLQASSVKKLCVVVVDDSPNDLENLRKEVGNRKNVRVVCPKVRRGFAGSVNDGFKAAMQYNPRFFMILNNDTVVDRRAVERLVEQCKSRHIVGPSIYRMDKEDEIWAYGFRLKLYRSILNRLVKRIDFKNSARSRIDMVTGCAALFRAEALQEIGLMDEKYFLYVEDMDFFYRAKKKGYQFFVIKDSRIWHRGGGSSEGPENPEVIYYMTRNMLRFIKTHGKPVHQAIFFHIFLHHLYKRSVYLTKKKNMTGVVAMVLGAKDFLSGRYGQNTHGRLRR